MVFFYFNMIYVIIRLCLDSIVRGTTSREIISMAREAGARKVYFASCAPPIRFPNVYGIDMPTRKELVAYGKTEQDVANEIGADCVIYQDLPDLISSVSQFSSEIKTFDVSVFNGSYVTGDINECYLDALQLERNEVNAESPSTEVMGLYNSYSVQQN
jgi:amidophosphoribosyltransferase